MGCVCEQSNEAHPKNRKETMQNLTRETVLETIPFATQLTMRSFKSWAIFPRVRIAWLRRSISDDGRTKDESRGVNSEFREELI